MGLLLGCSPVPTEIVGGSEGAGSTTGTGTGPSDASGPTSTGPVAEGSAGSGPGMPTGDTGTTASVDPVTTDPDTSSADDAPVTGSSSGDPSSSSGDPPTCDRLFGGAMGYTPCGEDETSCTFALDSNYANCNTLCGMFGHTCLRGHDNPDGLSCVIQGDLACDQAEGSDTTICVCAK